MQPLQVHYTSCCNGTTGYVGFQVRATSQNIDPIDLQEVVQRCNYRRPYLGDEIGKAEGTHAYPVACRSYRLSSGRIALTNIHYSDTDYSGREGNFFAHTLIVPESDSELRPVDYFLWDGWKSRLEANEDLALPPILPTIPLSELTLSARFTPDEFCKFLHQGQGRRQRLQNMIKALILSLSDSRSLIIRGNNTDNQLWIAAIQHCFPIVVAKSMDSSSYEYTPQRLPLLAATVKGSEINLDQAQRDYQFYVFDECYGVDSSVSNDSKWDAASIYAQLSVHLLLDEPGQQAGFYGFLDNLGFQSLDNSLGLASWIYSLSFADFVRPNADVLREMVEYALTIPPNNPAWTVMIERLETLLGEWAHDNNNHELRVRFLAVAAQAIADEQRYQAVTTAWMEMFLADMQKNRIPSSAFDNYLNIAEQILPSGNKALYASIIAPSTINEFKKILRYCSPTCAHYILEKVGKALTEQGCKSILEQAEIKLLLAALKDNPKSFKEIIPATMKLADTPEIFFEICQSVGLNDDMAQDKINQLGDLVAIQLADRENDFAQHVRNGLPKPVLLRELEYLIDNSKNKLETYNEHVKKLSATQHTLQFTDYAKIIDSLVAKLDSTSQLSLAEDLLASDRYIALHSVYPSSAEQLLNVLNNSVQLPPKDSINELVNERLPEIAQHLNISLLPNRVRIVRLISNAEDRDVVFPEQELASLRSDLHILKKLNRAEYDSVCDLLLQSTAYNVERFCSINHPLMICSFSQSQDKQFINQYNKLLNHILKTLSSESLAKYTYYWVWYDGINDLTEYLPIMKLVAKAISHRSDQKMIWKQLSVEPQDNNLNVNKEMAQERIRTLQNLVNDAKKGYIERVRDNLSGGMSRILNVIGLANMSKKVNTNGK